MAELAESFVHHSINKEVDGRTRYVRVNEASGMVYLLSVYGEAAIDLPFSPEEALTMAASLAHAAAAALKKR